MSWTSGPEAPPPDDAYGRVTNPERFRPLHRVADDIVARLEERFDVARIDPGDPPFDRVFRQVALAPSAGAPLTIRWTDFPGVHLTFGRWHDEPYPQCGCDACDEQVDDLIEDLERTIDALVSGRVRESVTSDADGWWLRFTFEFEGSGHRSRSRRLEEGDPLRAEPGDVMWPAWPHRHQRPVEASG